MQIEYLADHMGMAPVLAAWHYKEWQELLPSWTFEEALADLQSHVSRRLVPTTLVAVEKDSVIGSASLLLSDLDGWEHLSPWLASVFVVPECRGKGIGRHLVTHAVEEARLLGVPALYLFTAGQETFYERQGWTSFRRTRHHGRDVVIMQRLTIL